MFNISEIKNLSYMDFQNRLVDVYPVTVTHDYDWKIPISYSSTEQDDQ